MEGNFLWSTVYQPLRKAPLDYATKHCDVPVGSILGLTVAQEPIGGYIQVRYLTNEKSYLGWVKHRWVEKYSVVSGDVIKIKNATLNPNDFAQNIWYNGGIQYNLCGPFCVMYCKEWKEIDIEEWLDDWKVESPSLWKRIFRNGRGTTTSIADLWNMLDLFEEPPYKMTLQEWFIDNDLKRPLFTPDKLKATLETCRLIIYCKIDGMFGRLRPTGIKHWVAVESFVAEGRGGLVTLYNPASNAMEFYEWEQFIASVGNPYGVMVPR